MYCGYSFLSGGGRRVGVGDAAGTAGTQTQQRRNDVHDHVQHVRQKALQKMQSSIHGIPLIDVHCLLPLDPVVGPLRDGAGSTIRGFLAI